MSLIHRYLGRQLLLPTLASMAALFTLAILTQGLTFFDLIVERRQSALVFGELTLLAMPPLFAMLAPVALLIATILAYNRLHGDNEIVVAFAAGATRWAVVSPAVRIAVATALLVLFVNLFVQPAAARLMRERLFDVRTDLAAGLIREGEFVRPAPGLTVYAQDVEPDGTIRNIWINEERAQEAGVSFNARMANIVEQNGAPVLVLRDGSSNGLRRNGVLSYVAFDEYRYDLRPFLNTTDAIHYKFSDRWLHELLFPDLRSPWARANVDKMAAEAHGRLSSPLYNIAFVLLGLAAVLGGTFSRLGYARRIAAFALGATLIRIVGFAMQSAAADAAILNVVQYLLPIGACVWAWRTLFPRRLTSPLGGTIPALQPV